ncbi:MAG TPA: hypothetical protein VIJ25_12690, partial [Methylococcales bacterium]
MEIAKRGQAINRTAWSFPSFVISLPDWVKSAVPSPEHIYSSDEEKMFLVVSLSRLNSEHATGGPFGAAIFDGQ